MITKLLAERQHLAIEGLSTCTDSTELTSTVSSPDLIHRKKKHEMHLTFSDLIVSTPTMIDSSPQSTATVFTCIGSAISDFESSQCSTESLTEDWSSCNEHVAVYLRNPSIDANNRANLRFKRSVSDTDGGSQEENDGSKAIESDFIKGDLNCQTVDGDPLEYMYRKDLSPPMFFLFDTKELTFKPSMAKHENNNSNTPALTP